MAVCGSWGAAEEAWGELVYQAQRKMGARAAVHAATAVPVIASSEAPVHVMAGRGAEAAVAAVSGGDAKPQVCWFCLVPGHSFKFTAALQAAQAGDAPIVIRIDTDAGHGAGKPVSKLIDERADVLAFLELALGPHEKPMIRPEL